MALAGNNRGTGSTNTGGQSTLAVVPTSNSTAGSLMFLFVAYDNSGASGVDPMGTGQGGFPSGACTDSLGNAWWPVDSANNTAGVANDGVSLRVFLSYTKWALTTADTITVSFNGITTVARAWTLIEVTAAAGKYPLRIGGISATGTSTTPSVTSDTAAIGDIVIGCFGAQGNAAITGDSDTTNGTWSTQQTSGVGVGAAGMEIASQTKVTITASGTQTYNTTITSAVWAAFALTYRETTNAVFKTPHPNPWTQAPRRAASW